MVFLNTSDLYIEAPHCAKSILERPKDLVAIVGLGETIWDLGTILEKMPLTNLIQ
jgi:hypothetical protein